MERLREIARREHAPEELLRLSDAEFLRTLGLLKAGRLTRAGVLLVGKDDLIQEAVPNYAWTYLKMCSDTDYSDRRDGREAIPAALAVLIDRIMADNPITTVEQGLFHFEYRTYPEIAIREALLNAFSHADYRIGGPVLVKHFSKRLEISNAGGFVGGISPDNILHHQPVARNPHLVDVLTRLRLVNRGNLGVQRMYSAMLMEGKEPPIIEERGESVRVVLLAGDVSVPFRVFVAEESERRRILSVDHLLILQHLVRRAEIDTATAGRICQRSEAEIREVLAEMERDLGYLDRGGTGRGTYWTLAAALYGRISKPGLSDRDRRVDWEVAKTRVLSILKQRGKHSESGLANREIRQVTRLNRAQVVRLMHELLKEDSHLVLSGKGRAAKYEYRL